MAAATGPGAGPGRTTDWQIATVESVHAESPRVKLFRLKLPAGQKFSAGQYYDIRLTAPDGYQAQRSYSISSSPEKPGVIELVIELIPGGEVSSYFHEAVVPGERIELRGPIGGHFTWTPNYIKPLLLVAGGSGIAPLMSIIRRRATLDSSPRMLLMFSVRTEHDILFRQELERMAHEDADFDLTITLTRAVPEGWTGETRRIDAQMIDTAFDAATGKTRLREAGTGTPEAAKAAPNPAGQPFGRAYICGGTGFVESIASYLLETGMDYDDIRTERFGP